MGFFIIMNPSGNQYSYTAPNVNASNVPGQTVNGVSGVGGYTMPDYSSIAKTNNANSQAFNQGQQNQITGFQGAYQSAVNALPTYQQLNQQANDQYNVPTLAANANSLNNTVLQIPRTYSQATQGTDTNNNQLMQLIGQKQWELAPLAQAATNSAQTAQGLANTSVGYGIQNEAQQLSPFANTIPLQNTQLSNAGANFTQQQSDQLQALELAVQQGVSLSGAQLQQLASLQNAKTTADAAISAAKIAAQNQNIPAGNTYYNPTTGQYYNPTTKVSAPQ